MQNCKGKLLDGKNALVTGGNRGIGASIVKALAAQGANVIFNSSTPNPTAELFAADIAREFGVQCVYVTCDVRVESEIDNMITIAKERFKRIDILMNNAGKPCFNAIENLKLTDFVDSMKCNLTAPLLFCKKIVPMMKENKWGRIVNFSSATTMKTEPNLGGYIIPKAGVNSLTKVLAKEVGTFGITVNAIVPGCTDTDMLNKGVNEYAANMGVSREVILGGVLGQHIIKEVINPDMVADFAIYLCTNSGRGLTGGLFPVDNGYTC